MTPPTDRPTRCGTCGRDRSAVNYCRYPLNNPPPHRHCEPCPDAFHDQPAPEPAAPDLLKAAHEAVDHLDNEHVCSNHTCRRCEDAHAAIDAAVLLLRDQLDAHHNYSMTKAEECEACARTAARQKGRKP